MPEITDKINIKTRDRGINLNKNSLFISRFLIPSVKIRSILQAKVKGNIITDKLIISKNKSLPDFP